MKKQHTTERLVATTEEIYEIFGKDYPDRKLDHYISGKQDSRWVSEVSIYATAGVEFCKQDLADVIKRMYLYLTANPEIKNPIMVVLHEERELPRVELSFAYLPIEL